MLQFVADIEKFGQQGEKTGWTYIFISAELAEKILPGNKKSIRVKGYLDQLYIEKTAIIPMGNGDFILPLNGVHRKQLKKGKGNQVKVKIELDKSEYQLNEDLMQCMSEELPALEKFMALPKSHQHYYSKYVDAAKTMPTKAKRIAGIIRSMHLGLTYPEMLRAMKEAKA